MFLTAEEMDLTHSRRKQRVMRSLMIEPNQWQIARRICQDPYVGETECLRGLFLPDRPAGKIIWWPARYMSHSNGLNWLKIPKEERKLEIEVNLSTDSRLWFVPDENDREIEQEFFSQPTICNHHEGWLSTGRSYITIVDKKIRLQAIAAFQEKTSESNHDNG